MVRIEDGKVLEKSRRAGRMLGMEPSEAFEYTFLELHDNVEVMEIEKTGTGDSRETEELLGRLGDGYDVIKDTGDKYRIEVR